MLDIFIRHHEARHAVVTVVQEDGELHVEAVDGMGRSRAVSRKRMDGYPVAQ